MQHSGAMSWNEFIQMDGTEEIPLQLVDTPIFFEVDDCNAIQKFVPTLLKWRSVSLAISACNRMRLVVESLKVVNEEKAEQTATQIDLAFAEPSQLPIEEPFRFDGQEHRCRWIETRMPKFVCNYFRTPDGKLRLVMESVEAVDRGKVDQVAREVYARVDFVTTLSIGPVEGSQDPGLLNMIPGAAPAQHADAGGWIDFVNEVAGWPVGPVGEVVDSSYSTTIFNEDEPVLGRIIDRFSQGSTMSVHPWENFQSTPDLPGSQVLDTSGVWTQSVNTSTRPANDVMESGQCDQEHHESSDSDSPLKTMQEDQRWKELIAVAVTNKIEDIYNEINDASDRSKLQSTRSETKGNSDKLKKEVTNFHEKFNHMCEELSNTLTRISRSVPAHIQQQLTRALSQVRNFKVKELKHLVTEAGKITGKLEKIVKELGNRELSASKLFQSYTSSVAQMVESVLTMTANFISVADFDRYSREFYDLPRFRAGVGKLGYVQLI